jgi:hypothetical protein
MGDKFFVVGVKNVGKDKILNMAAIYDLSSRSWSPVELPLEMQKITDHPSFENGYRITAVASVGSNIFVMGSKVINQFESKQGWRLFTPSTHSWSDEKKGPTRFWRPFATSVGETVFLLGDGIVGSSYYGNLDRNEWEPVPGVSLGVNLLDNLAGVQTGKDKLVVWGGHESTRMGARPAILRNIGYTIDTSTFKKVDLPASPFKARSHHGAAKIGSKVIFWGGLVGDEVHPDNPSEVTKQAAVFDIEANMWTCFN